MFPSLSRKLFATTLFLLIPFILMGSLVSVQAKVEPLTSSQLDVSPAMYLPILMSPASEQPQPPTLIAPENGASLDTLIPTFVWQPAPLPEGVDVGSCLTFDPDPDNLDSCWSSGYSGATDILQTVAWFNFEPDTVYYWRVGHLYDWDYDNINWSETRSFRTGPAGGIIPAAPVLHSPANGSSTTHNDLFLEWNAVQGATKYSVSIRQPGGSGYGWSEVEDQYLDLGDDWYSYIFPPGGPYRWYVEARNDYAWSEGSEIWTFNIIEGRMRGAAEVATPVATFRMPDGSERYIGLR